MSDIALPGSPSTSPSGTYRLSVFDDADADGHPMQGFRIEDASGRVVLAPDERWSTRHRLYMLWGDDDSVWVYSSDVGTSIWIRSGSAWQASDYASHRDQRPPRFLIDTVPKLFP